MHYQLTVDWAPAYELVISLEAYLFHNAKSLDLGTDWVAEVKRRLPAELAGLKKWPHDEDPFILAVLVRQSPAPRTAEPFLTWLGSLSTGELYERVAPYMPASASDLLRDLRSVVDRYLVLLNAWHAAYFHTVEQSVLDRLAAEAADRRERARGQEPVAAIDEATTGLLVESTELDEVLLVPQYHFRPLNQHSKCGRVLVIFYPMPEEAPGPGLPPPRVLRMARALGDENRLRILHFLADGRPHTFTEVLKHAGLAKNSVFYHLAQLRSAGLTHVYLSGDCGDHRHMARRASLDELGPRLQQYLDER